MTPHDPEQHQQGYTLIALAAAIVFMVVLYTAIDIAIDIF